MQKQKKDGFLHGAYAGINTQNAKRLKRSVPKKETREEIYFLHTVSGDVILNGVGFVEIENGKVILPNAEFVKDGSGVMMIK